MLILACSFLVFFCFCWIVIERSVKRFFFLEIILFAFSGYFLQFQLCETQNGTGKSWIAFVGG